MFKANSIQRHLKYAFVAFKVKIERIPLDTVFDYGFDINHGVENGIVTVVVFGIGTGKDSPVANNIPKMFIAINVRTM